MTRLATALLGLALLASPLATALADDTPPPVQAVAIDDNTTVAIATVAETHTDILAVIVNNELVWTQGGYILEFGAPPGSDIAPGTDITGSGIKELLVTEYSGGAHCCTTYYVYAFEPFFRRLAVIDTQSSGARFEDLDGKPGLEVITADNTFAYWKTYYAASPKPQVILAWDGTAFVPSAALMAAPAPSAADLKAQAARVAASDQWTADDLDPDLWRRMLDLLYSGHADLAWSFLDDGWPAARDGKDAFARAFKCELAASPFWDAVAAINKLDTNPPADCPSDS